MFGIAAFLMLWSGVLPAESPDGTPKSAGAEALPRLSSEFEQAQRAAFEGAGRPNTASERASSAGANPDPRRYARRCLDLAREAGEEGVAVDALVWVARPAGRTPEHNEAIGQ